MTTIVCPVGLHRGADSPADDHACKHIDDEGNEHRTAPGGDEGEIRDPQLIWPLGPGIDDEPSPKGAVPPYRESSS